MNYKPRSRYHFCRRKAKSITYSECVSVILVIQRVTCMLRIILSCVACLGASYFSTSSRRQHDFLKNVEHKGVLTFSTNFA
jgi:hypothetical protein